MKFFKVIAIATIALASIGAAQAQNLYAGVAYSQMKVDTDVGAVTPTIIVFSLGYSVNENFAVEGRLGASASSGSVTVIGVPVSFKIDSYSALYLKGILPVSDQFGVYGLLGYNNSNVTASASGTSASDSKSGSTYGVGAEFSVAKNIGLTGEWTRNYSDATSMSFGVKYKF